MGTNGQSWGVMFRIKRDQKKKKTVLKEGGVNCIVDTRVPSCLKFPGSRINRALDLRFSTKQLKILWIAKEKQFIDASWQWHQNIIYAKNIFFFPTFTYYYFCIQIKFDFHGEALFDWLWVCDLRSVPCPERSLHNWQLSPADQCGEAPNATNSVRQQGESQSMELSPVMLQPSLLPIETWLCCQNTAKVGTFHFPAAFSSHLLFNFPLDFFKSSFSNFLWCLGLNTAFVNQRASNSALQLTVLRFRYIRRPWTYFPGPWKKGTVPLREI